AVEITQDTLQFINVTKLYNLGRPVNTIRDDYFPFFSNDLKSMYYTRRGEFKDEDLIRARRRSPTDPFATDRVDNFNTLRPEGMVSLVRDGERIFYTVCNPGVTRGACDLYAGWLSNGKITRSEVLPDYVNSDVWESQPSISCDGQELYFVSTRPGGLGGSDIYRCIKKADGTWGEPKNLGDGVNTPEHEEGPFLSNDGKALYFSSSGHLSLGDQDIFVSYWDNVQGRFTQAINLGPPVNGPHRELGFHLTSNGRTGYVASDRPGGIGELDIYSFELSERLNGKPITYVSGYVTDSLTGEPITDQAVPVGGAGKTYYTNYAGRFFICAPANGTLPLTVTHPDYLPFARDFAIPPWENLETYRIDLMLVKESPPELPPNLTAKSVEPPPPDTISRKTRIIKRPHIVRFNFDDASLLPIQIEGIEKFVNQIKDKSILKIVITGFTDNVGDESYNIRLSQNRAKAVGIHLQTAGLKANEVKIVGLGELPGATNRQLNRKVEIVVTYRELVEIN
ncbi:MAG: OmpA family protein, partial [Bacteroidota bacterium]